MRLFEIAISAFIYDRFTDFNNSFMLFQKKTGGTPDLFNQAHRRALLAWLNQWQCRQFSKDYHTLASREILAWYKGFDAVRLPYELELWRMDKEMIDNAAAEYGRLVSKTAALRERDGIELTVTVGPTGASKILFAIRPRSMVPWDAAMRKGLKYDGSLESYRDFLMRVHSNLAELRKACAEEGFKIDRLPDKIGRPKSTPSQLVGEYYYLTLTRGLTREDFERVRGYALFAGLG